MTDQVASLAEASDISGDLTDPKHWGGIWTRSAVASPKIPFSRREFIGRATDKMLVSIIDQVASDSADILELGCAPGWKLERLGRRRPQHRYHGLDYSPEGVEITRGFHQKCGFKSTIHQGDLRTFEPSKKKEYDVVYSCGLIEHFTDPLPILRNHARLCRPGGHVVITIPNYSVPIIKWFIKRLDPEALVTHNFKLMNVSVIENLMKDAGLVDVRVGKAGNMKISSNCGNVTAMRVIYRTCARSWNLFSVLFSLSILWQDTIWAVGAVNGAASDHSTATA